VRSKVRCSSDHGGCSRCASRGVQCTNQGTLGGQNAAKIAFEADGDSQVQTASLQLTGISLVDLAPQSSDEFGPDLDSPSVEIEETSTTGNPSDTTFTWESDIFGPGWSCMSDLTSNLGEDYALGHCVDPCSISGELQSASNITTLSEQSLQPSPSIPVSLPYRDPPSLFGRREFSEPELELTGDLALHMLRSYPYLMANQGSVPPFIHPKYQYLFKNDTARPSPLYAALRLARMRLHGQPRNKTLIWKLIRIEQERLLNEVRTDTPC
jgi:hypothetical protein